MADKSKDIKGRKKSRRALLIELENVAVNGRGIIYDVLSSVMSGKDIEISPAMYSRHCVDVPIGLCVDRILETSGKTRLSKDKLASEIEEGIKLSLTDNSVKIDKAVASLIDRAVSEEFCVGALSILDQDSARKLLDTTGLSEKGVLIHACSDGDGSLSGREPWLTLARDVKCRPIRSVALASSAYAARGALAAGMKCVVLPDEYTSFQDFGGADFVFDKLDSEAADSILALCPKEEP